MTRVSSTTENAGAGRVSPPAWIVWPLVAVVLGALWLGIGSPGGIDLVVNRQDFALYNVATSALLVLTATDSARYVHVLEVAIALYAIHGAAHLLRYAGVLPRRPDRGLELAQGLPLVSAAVGLFLFHP